MNRRLQHVTLSWATAIVALVVSASAAQAQAPGYTYTKITIPGATFIEVAGINSAGQMVGTYFDEAGIPHAFTHDGTTHTVVNFPGAGFNYAFGISPTGQIVGSHAHTLEVGPYHAFLLDGGVYTQFDFPDRETDARAINSLGHIVGIYNSGFGTHDYGFLKVGDTYTTIDYPASAATYVFGLNDAGTITGTYRDSLWRLRGFRYDAGVFTQITYPGSSETYIGGINNLGAMTGWSTQVGKSIGFVLNGMSFRSVMVPFAGATGTRPRAINDAGVVVGTYFAPDCPSGSCAFVARPTAGVPPVCDQTAAMTYASNTLTLNFTLKTSSSMTWTTWFVIGNQVFPGFTTSVPALATALPVTVPIAPVPPIGMVTLLSTLANSSGTMCADFATVNTGTK